jgi:hypothetical protein
MVREGETSRFYHWWWGTSQFEGEGRENVKRKRFYQRQENFCLSNLTLLNIFLGWVQWSELVWCWKHWRHGKRFTIDMVEISPSKMQPLAHMQECWICLHHISWRHSWTINVWTLQQNTRLRILLIISWSWLKFWLSWLISEALEFLRSFLHGIQCVSLGGCWHDMWLCFYTCIVWLSGQSCPLFLCHSMNVLNHPKEQDKPFTACNGVHTGLL